MMNCKDCPYAKGKEKISRMPCVDGEFHDACQKEPEIRRQSGKKRLSRREKDEKHIRHLRKLAALNEIDCRKNTMYGGVVYLESDGLKKKSYYRRYWRGCHNNRFKYWRKIAGRKVRRYKGDVHNGGFYKKVFDYWWTVD